MVITNIWVMMHDENVYPDPFVFNPERFTGTNPQADPRECVFCICAGQHLAETSLWIQMVLPLATVTISKAVDEDGKTIEPKVEFTTAIVSHVEPFQYQITLRSLRNLALMRQILPDTV
ncbi:hypothetical protein B0H17DRAFT_1128640 [Mycena rosella]|uniref:Uncharacterized protein n=1 Tax=Mycena rosella TaxID=1033263 RepID=A0AAD7GPB2_MYCRO|nr:hypothetical protein B0H17DRAFT_1128640 [Mycena rosella]